MAEPKFELVSVESHKHIKIDHNNYNIPENQVNAVTVVASELSTLIHEYPIFIVKHHKTEEFQLVAILGLQPGENLYLDGDNWRVKSKPMDVLRKPFQAYIPDVSNPTEGHIAIDINHPLVTKDKGEALFDDKGERTPYFARIEQTFSQLMGANKYTTKLLKTASEMALIEPLTLDINLPNGEKRQLNGLYGFSQEKITALKGKELEKCHREGILQVCHLILTSAAHLQTLVEWASEK